MLRVMPDWRKSHDGTSNFTLRTIILTRPTEVLEVPMNRTVNIFEAQTYFSWLIKMIQETGDSYPEVKAVWE